MTVHDGDLEALVGSSGLVTGFWRKACRDSGGCIRRPDHLGPWYMVTYTLVSDEKVVQLVYPYSSGGPVAYVPPDQRFFRTQRTTGVWYVGALPLRWSLERLGVPLSTPSVEPVATAAPLDRDPWTDLRRSCGRPCLSCAWRSPAPPPSRGR